MKKVMILILVSFLIIGYSHAQNRSVLISGKMNSLNDGDIVNINVSEYGYPLSMFDNEFSCTLNNHCFHLSLPVTNHPLLIDVSFKQRIPKSADANKLNRLLLTNYIIEKCDKIKLIEQNGKYTFSGKGARKFKLSQQLNIISSKYSGGFAYDNPKDVLIRYKKQDSSFLEKIALIERNKKYISPDAFNLLKADCLGDLFARSNGLTNMSDSERRIAISSLSKYKSQIPERYLALSEFNKKDILIYSSNYTYWGLPEKYNLDSCYKMNRPFSKSSYYHYLMSSYKGGLRERLLMNYIIPQLDSSGSVLPYVDSTLNILKIACFKNLLYELKSHRQPGAKAFNFSLPDTSGKTYRFSDYKGKIILIDFWFTGCGSCATAKPFVEKVEKKFQGKQVVFFTVNNDRDKSTWVKSVKSGRYTSDYGINLFTEGKAFNHPISKYYNIDGGPYFILIGKNGLLTTIPENPSNDNGQQLTALIERELRK